MATTTDAPEVETEKARSEHPDSVRVIVGSTEKEFVVHKDILCSTSDFFRCILNGAWKDSGDGDIKLPEIDEDGFTTYVDWLSSKTLDDLYPGTPCHSLHHSSPKKCGRFCFAFRAYLLGDFLQDCHFCNAAIDCVMSNSAKRERHPDSENIRRYWDLIPKSSRFRRLSIDLRAYYCNAASFKKHAQAWPHDYLLEVAGVWHGLYDKDIKAIRPGNRERCYYHENKDKPDHCKLSKS